MPIAGTFTWTARSCTQPKPWHPVSAEGMGELLARDQHPMVWDLWDEQGACPCSCPDHSSTFSSPALHPPVPC